MSIFKNSLYILLAFTFTVSCTPSSTESAAKPKMVNGFQVVFKKPNSEGVIAQFNDQKIERDVIIKGATNYQRLQESLRAFEMALAYKKIKEDFKVHLEGGEALEVDFYQDKPVRDFGIYLRMANVEPEKNIKINFKGVSDESDLIAQARENKYFKKDLDLNHTAYNQMLQQAHDDVMRKLWETLTYLTLKYEADKQGIQTKELLEKNNLMKATEATDEEVKTFLASINAKLSEINEKQFERFRAVVSQKNQDIKIRDFINKQILKTPITVFVDQPDESIQVSQANTIYKGPQDGAIQIELFTDFICNDCKSVWKSVQNAQSKYGEDLKLGINNYFRNNDLFAIFVAEASRCVKDQGEKYFWTFIDQIQSYEGDVSEQTLNEKAESLGVNMDDYKKCVMDRTHKEEVAKQHAYGNSLGFNRVPTMVVNGKVFAGHVKMEDLEPLLKEHSQGKKGKGFLASLWQKISSIF